MQTATRAPGHPARVGTRSRNPRLPSPSRHSVTVTGVHGTMEEARVILDVGSTRSMIGEARMAPLDVSLIEPTPEAAAEAGTEGEDRREGVGSTAATLAVLHPCVTGLATATVCGDQPDFLLREPTTVPDRPLSAGGATSKATASASVVVLAMTAVTRDRAIQTAGFRDRVAFAMAAVSGRLDACSARIRSTAPLWTMRMTT